MRFLWPGQAADAKFNSEDAMKNGLRARAAIIFFPFFIGPMLTHAALDRSVSTSRQFIVYGGTTELRGSISDLAERTKKNLLRILQQSDDWKTPIILNLQFPQANIPDVPLNGRYFSQTGAGLKYQLDLTIGADLDIVSIQRDLLWAILLEMIYRGQPDLPPGTAYVQPPQWLIEGLLAAQPGENRTTVMEALGPILANNNATALKEFLRQKRDLLDSPGQAVYRAYSLALVELVIDEPDGPSRLVRYIANLSRASNDPLSDLKTHFPLLAGIQDVDTLWKSKIGAVSGARDYGLLTFAATERQLEDLLSHWSTDVKDPAQETLEKLVAKKIPVEKARQLRRLSESLLVLAAQANPVLRPIVTEYGNMVQRIAANRRRGMDVRLARLKSTRARLAARMSDIDDYMNWFEATQASTHSGDFAAYLRAVEKSSQPQPRRRDPLSVYLDALEEQF